MNKIELMEIINNGENSTVEFKRDNLRAEQLAKEIVAFANSYGGRILIGVENDGEISGKVNNQLKVAVLTVNSGIMKPFVVKFKDREDIYIRIGSISKLATREQIIRLSEISGLIHVETLPVPGAYYDSLDRIRYENYFKDIIKDPQLPKTEDDWKQHLKDNGFLTDTEFQQNLCTIAGILLFGKKPRRFLKQAGIRFMAFNSHDKEYKALIDSIIDAPLIGRWDVDKNGQLSLIDAGLIEKFMNMVEPYISEETDLIEVSLRRSKKWLYPLEVIRELVLNALAHRDWTRNVDIEISLYKDRIEIISPGALPNSMTVEKMVGGRRTPRNPIIMDVLRDYQYVDARGMGIRIKVIPIMKSFNNTSPLFEANEDFLKTTLYLQSPDNIDHKYDPNDPIVDPKTGNNDPIVDPKTGNNDPIDPIIDPNHDPKIGHNDPNLHILSLVATNENITYQELSDELGLSLATIKRRISALKKAKKIERIGTSRGGYWKIIKPK